MLGEFTLALETLIEARYVRRINRRIPHSIEREVVYVLTPAGKRYAARKGIRSA